MNLRLFALGGQAPLAAAIGARLGVHPGRSELREFEGGEHTLRALDPVRGDDVYVLHSLHGDASLSINDRLCRTWFFCAALRDHGAGRITLLAPYLGYARKDRRTRRQDPLGTRYLAQLTEAAGIDRVLTLDVHNPAAYENAFRHPAYNLEARPLLAAALAAHLHRDERVLVLSPDAGGIKRAEALRATLQTHLAAPVTLGMMEKYRSGGQLSGSRLFAEVEGRTVVLVDDLVARGDTLARAATAAAAAGAARILAAASHGLFAPGALDTLAGAPWQRLIVTDSITPTALKGTPLATRVQVLDTTALWADAVDALYHERAFSDVAAD